MRTVPLILHVYERASSRRAFHQELPALFSRLSVEDGHELGRQALALHDQEQRRAAEEILLFLAALCPGALEGLHRPLLVRRILDAPELYRGADPATRDAFLQLICTGPWSESGQLERLLRAFAWIGDGEAVEAFARWRRRPPAWASALVHPPDHYTEVAGWTLTDDGERRDLYSETCLRLDPIGTDDEVAPARRASAGRDLPGGCPHCGLRLTAGLELPASVLSPVLPRAAASLPSLPRRDGPASDRADRWDRADRADRDRAGGRLTLAACARCCRDGIVFARLDDRLDGTRPAITVRPRHRRLDPRAPFSPLPRGTVTAGPPRRSPFETHREILLTARSQLGGHPGWLEEIIYPRCPGCDEHMPFVAGLDLTDLDDGTDGMLYAFVCLPCRTSATIAQGSPARS